MSHVKLKERCKSCDGSGKYWAPHQSEPVPCWTCRGRGYVHHVMMKPDPRWARQYDKEILRRLKVQ